MLLSFVSQGYIFNVYLHRIFFFARTNTLAVLGYRGTMSYGENEYLEKSFFF